ncbi:hypothetical protein Nmel_017326 [Mimus melanotis]
MFSPRSQSESSAVSSSVLCRVLLIKTEDLSDSLQSAIPPRSGHLVQGSSMMPGSQIAGIHYTMT